MLLTLKHLRTHSQSATGAPIAAGPLACTRLLRQAAASRSECIALQHGCSSSAKGVCAHLAFVRYQSRHEQAEDGTQTSGALGSRGGEGEGATPLQIFGSWRMSAANLREV